jgi:ABC-type Fe3+-hydroxamate transport system substrate-binding protein
MKKTILALSLAVAAACFGLTDRASADNITVKNAAGRLIAITDPSRIVSVAAR